MTVVVEVTSFISLYLNCEPGSALFLSERKVDRTKVLTLTQHVLFQTVPHQEDGVKNLRAELQQLNRHLQLHLASLGSNQPQDARPSIGAGSVQRNHSRFSSRVFSSRTFQLLCQLQRHLSRVHFLIVAKH